MDDKLFLTGLRLALMDWRLRRIKAVRAERGYSVEQVVSRVSWEVTTQRKIESGAKKPTKGELYELAEAFGVDVAYFLDENATPFPPLTAGAQAPASSEPDARNGSGTAGQAGSQRRLHTTVRSESEERRKPDGGDRRRKSG